MKRTNDVYRLQDIVGAKGEDTIGRGKNVFQLDINCGELDKWIRQDEQKKKTAAEEGQEPEATITEDEAIGKYLAAIYGDYDIDCTRLNLQRAPGGYLTRTEKPFSYKSFHKTNKQGE